MFVRIFIFDILEKGGSVIILLLLLQHYDSVYLLTQVINIFVNPSKLPYGTLIYTLVITACCDFLPTCINIISLVAISVSFASGELTDQHECK